jgi:hypothetical protein
MFENWGLRRIFEPKKEEVAGGWRRLHNELHNFTYFKWYYKGNQINDDEIGWACGTYGRDE